MLACAIFPVAMVLLSPLQILDEAFKPKKCDCGTAASPLHINAQIKQGNKALAFNIITIKSTEM